MIARYGTRYALYRQGVIAFPWYRSKHRMWFTETCCVVSGWPTTAVLNALSFDAYDDRGDQKPNYKENIVVTVLSVPYVQVYCTQFMYAL